MKQQRVKKDYISSKFFKKRLYFFYFCTLFRYGMTKDVWVYVNNRRLIGRLGKNRSGVWSYAGLTWKGCGLKVGVG